MRVYFEIDFFALKISIETFKFFNLQMLNFIIQGNSMVLKNRGICQKLLDFRKFSIKIVSGFFPQHIPSFSFFVNSKGKSSFPMKNRYFLIIKNKNIINFVIKFLIHQFICF